MSKALPKGGSALRYVQGYEGPAVAGPLQIRVWGRLNGGGYVIAIPKLNDGERGPELRRVAAVATRLARHADIRNARGSDLIVTDGDGSGGVPGRVPAGAPPDPVGSLVAGDRPAERGGVAGAGSQDEADSGTNGMLSNGKMMPRQDLFSN
jgi:hypothetical protein